MPLEVDTRKGDARNLKNKDFAFGHYVNTACRERGEELVKEVVEHRKKRSEGVRKEIGQQAKEAAGIMGAMAKGRVWSKGKRYDCFECAYRGLGIRDGYGNRLCGFKCNNGQYFKQKEAE